MCVGVGVHTSVMHIIGAFVYEYSYIVTIFIYVIPFGEFKHLSYFLTVRAFLIREFSTPSFELMHCIFILSIQKPSLYERLCVCVCAFVSYRYLGLASPKNGSRFRCGVWLGIYTNNSHRHYCILLLYTCTSSIEYTTYTHTLKF